MAGNHEELVGQRFGHLTVLKFLGVNGTRYKYLCKCDCGKEKEADKHFLLNGQTVSCGCQRTYKKRAGRPPEQIRTRSFLQMEDILKQNVTVVEEEYSQTAESLCNNCLHSAAPPSLQCIWDESKATLLPDGATVLITPARVDKKGCILVKVRECPLYQDVRLPENKAILLEARKQNQLGADMAEIWKKTRNCKNKNNDDWR